ncbi:hypothetical protein PAXRUDRAFT_112179, partial [Paxillus rubicundulus Ve08.2h10]
FVGKPPAGLSPHAIPIVHRLPTATYQTANGPMTYFIPKPDHKAPYYCIGHGLAIGIFVNWVLISPLVHGVSGASFKGYDTLEEAEDVLELLIEAGMLTTIR